MDSNNQAVTSATTDAERANGLQELELLTARYQQLSWCTSAEDQRERHLLDAAAMKLYTTLHPRSVHSWHESYEVVLRGQRRAARA
jgi:hypothetical protein